MTDKISSLTLKHDRAGLTETTVLIDKEHEVVGDELKSAVNELVDTRPVTKFLRRETRITDPSIPSQLFGLVSFVPAKGARADDKGMFGSIKLRGNYSSVEEAAEKARELVKKVDSYHKIYTVHVGKPFPITLSSDYSGEVDEVQLDKQIVDMYSQDIKSKREKEEKDMKEIQEREKNLTSEIKRETEDPLEYYTMVQTKRANLIWTYKKTEEKMAEMRGLIIKARKEIAELDEKQPELRQQYFTHYMDARKQSGLDEGKLGDNFIKFLAEDIELDFLRDGYVEKPKTRVDITYQRNFAVSVLEKARELTTCRDEENKTARLAQIPKTADALSELELLKLEDDRVLSVVNDLMVETIKLQRLL